MDPKIHLGKLSTFFPQKRNPNRHTERGLSLLESAMSSVGYVAPMTATADGEVIDGSARLEKSALVFPDKDPLIVDHDGSRPVIMRRTDIPNANDPRAKQVSYGANRISEVNLSLDPEMLHEDFFQFDLKPMWTEEEVKWATDNAGPDEQKEPENPLPDTTTARQTLSERFIVPPFSVLDARQGYWQDRKRAWLALGIQSELGRGGAPGGSPRPATQLTDSGHTVRGDGYGRAL